MCLQKKISELQKESFSWYPLPHHLVEEEELDSWDLVEVLALPPIWPYTANKVAPAVQQELQHYTQLHIKMPYRSGEGPLVIETLSLLSTLLSKPQSANHAQSSPRLAVDLTLPAKSAPLTTVTVALQDVLSLTDPCQPPALSQALYHHLHHRLHLWLRPTPLVTIKPASKLLAPPLPHPTSHLLSQGIHPHPSIVQC